MHRIDADGGAAPARRRHPKLRQRREVADAAVAVLGQRLEMRGHAEAAFAAAQPRRHGAARRRHHHAARVPGRAPANQTVRAGGQRRQCEPALHDLPPVGRGGAVRRRVVGTKRSSALLPSSRASQVERRAARDGPPSASTIDPRPRPRPSPAAAPAARVLRERDQPSAARPSSARRAPSPRAARGGLGGDVVLSRSPRPTRSARSRPCGRGAPAGRPGLAGSSHRPRAAAPASSTATRPRRADDGSVVAPATSCGRVPRAARCRARTRQRALARLRPADGDRVRARVERHATRSPGAVAAPRVEHRDERAAARFRPVAAGHRASVRAPPFDIGRPARVDGLAAKPTVVAQRRMRAPERGQRRGERDQVVVLRGPVEPGRRVVLRVGVVVAALRAARVRRPSRASACRARRTAWRAGCARRAAARRSIAGSSVAPSTPWFHE